MSEEPNEWILLFVKLPSAAKATSYVDTLLKALLILIGGPG